MIWIPQGDVVTAACLGIILLIAVIAVLLVGGVLRVWAWLMRSYPVVGITAPYGRFGRHFLGRYDFLVHNRVAWFVQESPSFFVPVAVFLARGISVSSFAVCFPFLLHYFHRTFVFPFYKRPGVGTPISIVLLAFFYCLCNGLAIARFFVSTKAYGSEWFLTPSYIIGVCLFLVGMLINVSHDYHLISLRSEVASYVLPKYGLFRFVVQPNYLGELVEWVGWSISTDWIGSWVFVFMTIANLLPRAIQSKRWYEEKLHDRDRCAMIPFIC